MLGATEASCGTKRLRREGRVPLQQQQTSPCPLHHLRDSQASDFRRGEAGQGGNWPSLSWPVAMGSAASSSSFTQLFLEEAMGLLGPRSDSPLRLIWGPDVGLRPPPSWSGVSFLLLQTQEAFLIFPNLQSVILVCSSLGKTEPLYTSRS